ncbi:pentapeptide repeat-containing protein [Streptosporangium carneum]|uniref:Oxidoreductase n=1 Tax=Streptosporangium carneum TaxID=47481 RepID=A0A9W6I871_9ACTN|nr:pentapeptide repeat-containing protein [Streptosporangium carneum]GLK13398.1 oxidoreductase [Streptosporangium carneum]
MRLARPFLRLTPAERRVWDAYPSGAWVDLRTGDAEADDPANGDGWGPERTIRAEVLSALLLGARQAEPGKTAGLRLAGAHVTGVLDVSDATLTGKLHLLNCNLPEGVSLTDATTAGVRFRGCEIERVRAARCTVNGLLEFDGSTIRSGVRLDNATVNGQFRLAGTRLSSPEGTQKASESVLQDVRRNLSEAEMRDRGLGQSQWALWAGGLTVEGGAFMRDMRVTGGMRIIGAKFNGGIYLQRSVIEATGPYAVQADFMESGAAEFSAGFTATGTVRMRNSRVHGVLSFDGATLKAPGRVLHLSHAQVEELILRPTSIEGEVNLAYSRIGVLLDSPSGYPDGVYLNGLTYEALRGGDWTVTDRLSWVAKDPYGYRPQPYEQLATWFRKIGHEPDARRVLLAKQRQRRHTLRPTGRIWGRLLDLVVGYGYRPWLAGLWVAVLLTTGTVVFSAVPPTQIDPDEVRSFQPLVYTLDLLVPVSVFEQRGAWEPVGWTQWLAWTLVASGWILATAMIAGAARVLRPSPSS